MTLVLLAIAAIVAYFYFNQYPFWSNWSYPYSNYFGYGNGYGNGYGGNAGYAGSVYSGNPLAYGTQGGYAGYGDFPSLGAAAAYLADMGSDGNALFRALSDQLYHDMGRNHRRVRREVVGYLAENRLQFRRYFNSPVEGYSEYLARMEMPGQYASQLELDAFVACYSKNLIIHSNDGTRRTLYSDKSARRRTLQIANYAGTEHYLSLQA